MPPSEERYAAMRWNSPLSEDHASRLLQRLAVSSDGLVVDLGCGWGELLVRAVADTGAKAIGVDTDEQLLQRGRRDLHRCGPRLGRDDERATQIARGRQAGRPVAPR